MQASAVHLRVGLMILGGIALLVGLIWFLAGSQIAMARCSRPTSASRCRDWRSARPSSIVA